MPAPTVQLATADEIRAIHRRATEIIDAIVDRDDDDGYDPDQHRIDNRQLCAAVEALRFCCVAAGELGDVTLLPLVAQAIEDRENVDDYVANHASTMAFALTLLLRAGAPAGAEVKELAGHRDPRVRQGIASGLLPRGERELALLEALATDPIPEVRSAAKKSLSTVREVVWWKGKFGADPVARLTQDEALALKPVLEELSALLDLSRYEIARQEERLCELAAALPDLLLVELTELLHSANDTYSIHFPKLVTAMLERHGGLDAFKRLCVVWSDDRLTSTTVDRVAVMITALPHESRVAACKELAVHAAAFPAPARCQLLHSPARMVAEIAAQAWPPGEDLTPLLEVVLAIPAGDGEEEGPDHVVSALRAAFQAEGADPTPFLERALEARLAGYPGTWRRVGSALDKLFERAQGPALRPAAEQAILGDNEDSIRWGLVQLVGPAHDPTRDAPPLELLARFLSEPRYRKVILSTEVLRQRAVALLRADLRAGRLAFEEACATLLLIGELYGGVAAGSFSSRRRRSDAEIEASRARERAELEAFLGLPELGGPPTAEEWAALRALRAGSAPLSEDALEDALRALPEGPWSPEDRAVLEEALRRLRAGTGDLAVPIAIALSSKPALPDLPLFDELLERGGRHARRLLQLFRGNVRERLGLPRKPEAPAAAGGAVAAGEGSAIEESAPRVSEGEWMDQEEDE